MKLKESHISLLIVAVILVVAAYQFATGHTGGFCQAQPATFTHYLV